jgi:hypothetical protein
VKDFGPEAQQAVNGTTQAAFSNYRVRFIKPDVAVVDALLTVRNVNGADGTTIPVIPINFFFVAVRHWRSMADSGWARAFRGRAAFRHDLSKLAGRILVPRSTQINKEPIATDTPEGQAGVFVVRRHHLLVRCSHWLNVPILLGLTLSGVSIYWASPVSRHKPDPLTGNFDPLADVGIWICAHVPGLHEYSSPPDSVYNHISLGTGMLALALRLHWLCAC